jgi:uncharacterized protein (TIGR00288 family)
MTIDRVMLLIDADNVSVDVMDQAVRLLLKQHGGLHVRRAYCTAESAVKHQTVFKHLGIKPMVNLAAGKNSTDIALAVDAIDLVLAERPDVVVIASSDSDFAPLVHRLREKGCVVRGIGQSGKTGDETQGVYDDFTVLEHRKGTADAEAAPARKSARAQGGHEGRGQAGCGQEDPAAKKAPATKTAAAKTPRKTVRARPQRPSRLKPCLKLKRSCRPTRRAAACGRTHRKPVRAMPAPPARPRCRPSWPACPNWPPARAWR